MIFKNPWLLFFIPLALGLMMAIRLHQKSRAVRLPSRRLVEGLPPTWRTYAAYILSVLKAGSVVLLITALAGPRAFLEETHFRTEGIDIVLAVDISASMMAMDFQLQGKPTTRLEAVKNAIQEFVTQRTDDRICMVAYAAKAYTVSPLTLDHAWLHQQIDRIEYGLIEDGTAVGYGITAAMARLRNSEAKSKVVILLTDGVNNVPRPDPITAAKAANALGVKIYTIGAGSDGVVPIKVKDQYGRVFYQRAMVELDEQMLQNIADITGGRYFEAADTRALKEVYAQIDTLEKTEFEEFSYKEYKELFPFFVWSGLGALLLELILSHTILIRIP
jgi:Ca-activated chloride channel family protein